MKDYVVFVFCFSFILVGYSQIEYPIHEDSKVREGVPKGEVLGPFIHGSIVFPETVRQYYIFAPNQYKKENPAALMIPFNGLNMADKKWKLPTVLDNLIHINEVPVTIGVFIEVGVQESQIDDTYDCPIRSVEYDSRSPKTASMVIDEILPKIKAKYAISNDPKDHLIAGNSSGGKAAYSIAWQRPDVFRHVFTGVGPYTSLRDGHEFLTLIRKTEHKPLCVYLQDGSKDLNNFSGNWFIANQYMFSSLEWAGYQVNHTWGDDTHGYNGRLPYNNQQYGRIIFFNTTENTLNTLDLDGNMNKLTTFNDDLKGLALPHNNEVCMCNTSKNQVEKIYPKRDVIAKNITCDNLLLTKKGIYFLSKLNNTYGFYQFKNKTISTFNTIENPSGISLSDEQSF